MRKPYERCIKHDRMYCFDGSCKAEETNSGDVTINTDGHLAMGLGSGLSIDLSDGSVGINVGGITIDS